jgi:hypothetical protein
VFNDPGRLENLRQSLACFAQQTWPYKEAVVINDTSLDVHRAVHGVRAIRIKAKYLGELKNLALYNAAGRMVLPVAGRLRVCPGIYQLSHAAAQ